MNAEEFLEKKGISINRNIDVRDQLGTLIKRIRLVDLMQEYAKLPTTKVSDLDIALAAGDDGVDLLRREGFIQGAKWMSVIKEIVRVV